MVVAARVCRKMGTHNSKGEVYDYGIRHSVGGEMFIDHT